MVSFLAAEIIQIANTPKRFEEEVMAKEFSGEAICLEHGSFQWHGFYYAGEIICNWQESLSKNCKTITKQGNEYRIPAVCPKCKRKYIQIKTEEIDNGI